MFRSLKQYRTPLYLFLACCMLLASVHLLQHSSPLTSSLYNTYTLQALQWRKGMIALDQNVEHLELAIYKDQYFVSFPPVPTLPVFLLTFFFDSKVPDTLLVQGYAIGLCLLVYRLLKRRIPELPAALVAFLFCFASSLLPLLQNGAVWYQAQLLALLLIIWALERMDQDHPTFSLFLYALAVGCRPLSVLYGPLLMFLFWRKHRNLRRLLPGILAGLSVAALYAWYNWVRFENIFEFGHNYLPEFSFQGGVQFSLDHIKKNIPTFVLGLPFEENDRLNWQLKQFGFSFFLANPLLLCLLIVFIWDLLRKRLSAFQAMTFGMFTLHCLLLLSHRTCGGFQYGARYWIDCLAYALLYPLFSKEPFVLEKPLRYTFLLLLVVGLVMAFTGSLAIRLPVLWAA